MDINSQAIKDACKFWLVERGYPEHKPPEFVMENLSELYSMLLSKGLVPEDRHVEEMFFKAAEQKYFERMFGL